MQKIKHRTFSAWKKSFEQGTNQVQLKEVQTKIYSADDLNVAPCLLIFGYKKQIRGLNFQPAKSSSQNTQIHWCSLNRILLSSNAGYLTSRILVILRCPRKIAIIGPWLFRVYRGWKTTHLCGDHFINHDIRIPFLTHQDSMESWFSSISNPWTLGETLQRGWTQVVTEGFFFRWVAQHSLTFWVVGAN